MNSMSLRWSFKVVSPIDPLFDYRKSGCLDYNGGHCSRTLSIATLYQSRIVGMVVRIVNIFKSLERCVFHRSHRVELAPIKRHPFNFFSSEGWETFISIKLRWRNGFDSFHRAFCQCFHMVPLPTRLTWNRCACHGQHLSWNRSQNHLCFLLSTQLIHNGPSRVYT